MVELKRALVCGALLLSSSFAVAQSVPMLTTFTFLTGIQDDGNSISLTGVLANTTTPTTVALGVIPDRCANLFFAMLSHPGTYTLTIEKDTVTDPVFGGTSVVFGNCRLNLSPLGLHGERQ